MEKQKAYQYEMTDETVSLEQDPGSLAQSSQTSARMLETVSGPPTLPWEMKYWEMNPILSHHVPILLLTFGHLLNALHQVQVMCDVRRENDVPDEVEHLFVLLVRKVFKNVAAF